MVTLTQTSLTFTVKTRSMLQLVGSAEKESEEVQSHGEVYEKPSPLDMEYLQALQGGLLGQHHSLHSHFGYTFVDHGAIYADLD